MKELLEEIKEIRNDINKSLLQNSNRIDYRYIKFQVTRLDNLIVKMEKWIKQ